MISPIILILNQKMSQYQTHNNMYEKDQKGDLLTSMTDLFNISTQEITTILLKETKKPYMKELLDNSLDLPSLSLPQLEIAITTARFLSIDLYELLSEFKWRIGENFDMMYKYYNPTEDRKRVKLSEKVSPALRQALIVNELELVMPHDLSLRCLNFPNCVYGSLDDYIDKAFSSSNIRLLKHYQDRLIYLLKSRKITPVNFSVRERLASYILDLEKENNFSYLTKLIRNSPNNISSVEILKKLGEPNETFIRKIISCDRADLFAFLMDNGKIELHLFKDQIFLNGCKKIIEYLNNGENIEGL